MRLWCRFIWRDQVLGIGIIVGPEIDIISEVVEYFPVRSRIENNYTGSRHGVAERRSFASPRIIAIWLVGIGLAIILVIEL